MAATSRTFNHLTNSARSANPARPSALLTRIFGTHVRTAELRETADPGLLYAAEREFCAGFAPKRIAEFAAGRLCARRALEDLGVTNAPIAVNADRSPRWPPGIVGSISHTSNYGCAVVAHASDLTSIGVDVEIVGRVTAELDTLVFTARERGFLAALPTAERARAATVIFSAKEAFYKCQYAITQQWLDFQDVSLELATSDLVSGAFSAEVAGRVARTGTADFPQRGRFRIDGDIALTGITLPS
jgi:4'-phosphopantetheinyl transferase EntD